MQIGVLIYVADYDDDVDDNHNIGTKDNHNKDNLNICNYYNPDKKNPNNKVCMHFHDCVDLFAIATIIHKLSEVDLSPMFGICFNCMIGPQVLSIQFF